MQSDENVSLRNSPLVTRTRVRNQNATISKGDSLRQIKFQLSPKLNEEGTSQIKETQTSVKCNETDNAKELFEPKGEQGSKGQKLSKWKPYKRKLDFCYFCEAEVQNFARHIKRNHCMELDVARIFSKPVKSKERRNLLNNLRRKGNFLASGKKCFKPVRQPDLPNESLLPCDNCLGFFSAKLLYRHRKKCLGRISKGGAQAAGQSILSNNSKVDRRLKETVFPHMRADKVSLEAQKDGLICAFGTRYLNTHREKHFVSVTSRKMRELSKMLMEARKIEPTITTMLSALQPHNFDVFVEAAKQLGRYDAEKDVYLSPTVAMNISTSLKQCCDIAISYAYKKTGVFSTVSSVKVVADLKTLIHLFETNWKFDISSQAASNLNLKKWNKITVIPLASDLKLLRKHLIEVAETASKQLTGASSSSNVSAYNKLVESVYCRVILLNRKRSGELQRMLLHTYQSASERPENEEYNTAVSSSEQILLKNLKRVVIRGKRGRGVPVLFSKDVQNHIKVLLDVRHNFVPKENPYLFGKADSLSHIIGYKTLTKYAKSSGVKNPSSISSTHLRKHLATLSQLFNLSEMEVEQLATFMGHTTNVHKNSYRLPDEIYQTTKISKLLLLMERGGTKTFKGKSLDEIDVNLEENLLNHVEENDKSDAEATIDEDTVPDSSKAASSSSAELVASGPVVPKKGKNRTVVPWTTEQKKVAKHFFKHHIRAGKAPKKEECERLKAQHTELLKNKEWTKIKVFVRNEYTKQKKLYFAV